jgi:hypothetical protein
MHFQGEATNWNFACQSTYMSLNLKSLAMRKSFVKPVILLTLIASLLFVSSCEKSVEVVEADLIGTWDIGQASVDIKVGPISLLKFLTSALPIPLEEAAAREIVAQYAAKFLEIGGGTVTFNEDYSYMIIQSELEEDGTWELEGDKLYLSGETLVVDPLNVESLNSSAAIVAWEQEQDINLGEEMDAIPVTIYIELNLSKQ